MPQSLILSTIVLKKLYIFEKHEIMKRKISNSYSGCFGVNYVLLPPIYNVVELPGIEVEFR